MTQSILGAESTPARVGAHQLDDPSYYKQGLSRQNSNTTIKGGSYQQIYQERQERQIRSVQQESASQTDIALEDLQKLIDRLTRAERQLNAENQANEELTEQLLHAEN